MARKNEIYWLCENARKLEKFAGHWIIFDVKEGVVSCGDSLKKIMKMVKKHKKGPEPFIFHVPTKDELGGEGFLSALKN